ncbi:MAG TPA: hypothetical protein VGC41_04610 [Kofleriaceae bacterium]
MKLAALTLVLFAASAHADPHYLIKQVEADKAASLARAMKFAGVKPTIEKGLRTFKVTSIHCSSTREGEDEELGTYACEVDGLKITDGPALLLMDALEAAGAAADDHMSQHTIDVTNEQCEVRSMPVPAANQQFFCRSFPPDQKITPKKMRVKDIVQPVQIPKQKT